MHDGVGHTPRPAIALAWADLLSPASSPVVMFFWQSMENPHSRGLCGTVCIWTHCWRTQPGKGSSVYAQGREHERRREGNEVLCREVSLPKVTQLISDGA